MPRNQTLRSFLENTAGLVTWWRLFTWHLGQRRFQFNHGASQNTRLTPSLGLADQEGGKHGADPAGYPDLALQTTLAGKGFRVPVIVKVRLPIDDAMQLLPGDRTGQQVGLSRNQLKRIKRRKALWN